jgi:hypothetical protein
VSATQPDIATQACNNTTRIMRAQAAGAVAVMFGRVQLPPLSASPDAVAWGGDPKGLTIPGVMIDEPDANTLRAALCPSLVNGQCATGAAVHGSLVDGPGQWGGLRVLDVDPDTGMTQVALLHSPHGTTFPPPDQGVYAPGPSVVAGKLAYVTWHADGLRVIDLSQQPPREVAHFVPPDTPDPTNTLPAKASVVGVAVSANLVVISDTNSGLYVLDRGASGGGSSLGIYLLIGLGVVTAVLTTSLVVRRRRV